MTTPTPGPPQHRAPSPQDVVSARHVVATSAGAPPAERTANQSASQPAHHASTDSAGTDSAATDNVATDNVATDNAAEAAAAEAVAAVDAARQRLDALAGQPVAGHVTVYDDVHQVLQSALATLDRS